jgi:hypothetical protein
VVVPDVTVGSCGGVAKWVEVGKSFGPGSGEHRGAYMRVHSAGNVYGHELKAMNTPIVVRDAYSQAYD